MEEIIAVFGAFVAGILAHIAFDFVMTSAVMREVNRRNADYGRTRKKEYAEELQEAVSEVIVMIKSGKKPDEALKEVAVRHPEVAMRLGAVFAKKKLGIDLGF